MTTALELAVLAVTELTQLTYVRDSWIDEVEVTYRRHAVMPEDLFVRVECVVRVARTLSDLQRKYGREDGQEV